MVLDSIEPEANQEAHDDAPRRADLVERGRPATRLAGPLGMSFDGSVALHTAHRCVVVAMVTALLGLAGMPVRLAAADGRLPLGGGAGIVINGDTMCTLTTIGSDRAGELIGFTSAHCGGPGAQLAVEGAERLGIVGVMVAGNDKLDYAVIKFDPAKVAPVATYNGFVISGIGPDPTFGQIACKQGRTTGNSCGVTWGMGQDPGTIVMQVCGASRRLRRAGDREQPAGRHDPWRVQRRPTGLHHQVHPAAHPGGRDGLQRDPGRHQRQEPARRRLRPDTG